MLFKSPLVEPHFYIKEQDLGKILRYCFLDSSIKILPCGFFLMNRSVFFKLISHMTKS